MASGDRERCERIVYTVGHSNRELSEFLRILNKYGIALVIDVRRWPASKRFPWFSRSSLELVLRSRAIDYVWLGDLLGGFRPGGYEAYMNSDEYRRGIERLRELIDSLNRGYPAIMCKERLWFKCHRRFIANTLVELGYQVIHIVDEGRVVVHKPPRQG